MKTIGIQIRLTGGAPISNRNAPRIFARSTRATDRAGNTLRNGLSPINNSTEIYHQRYAVKKEPEGYIFREVNNGAGICGHHSSVRRLLIATLLPFPYFIIEYI